jgi:chromosome segregation protein
MLKNRETLQKGFSERDDQLTSLRRQLDEITEKRIRMEVAAEKADAGLVASQNRLWETYQLTYANALPERAPINVGEAQAEAEQMREKLRDMGSINPNAIEEYQELTERIASLAAQKDDLSKAEQDLHQLIVSLLSEMRRTFRTSFEQINKHFSATFKELFGGGRAELVLGEGDIMECDIDIVAEPPGKRMQRITLLSGGERALTAISLLFALLKINPSPVCILDEIDTALDDNNTDKFAEYLSRYSNNMQFIVISHRKPTMSVCDSLYGFAMEEKGVSKLLSVKLNQ